VWEGWLGAEIRAHYFADLCGRYDRLQKAATWATLALSSSAFAAMIANGLQAHYSWLAPVLTFLTAAISLYSLVAQNQKKAFDSADLHLRWNTLARDYSALWDDMYSEYAARRFTALVQRELEASKSGTAFPFKPRRMLKWQELVEQHHRLERAA